MRGEIHTLRRLCLIAALLACLPIGVAPALAANEVPDYGTEALFGDWGGTRTELYQRGIAVEAMYRIDALRNNSGGIRRGGRPMTHLDLKMKADLDKLWDWKDVTGYVHFIDDNGSKVNANMTGSITGVSNIEVLVSTHRFFHLWLQKDFDDKQWSLLGGLYPIDAEFMAMDSASLFTQPPYGALADIALTRGPSIFDNPAFGLRLKWLSSDRSWYAQGAVLDGVPGNPNHPRGTHAAIHHKGNGTMNIAEFGWNPGETGHTFEPTTPDAGVPVDPVTKAHERAADRFGKYAVGLWGYSKKVNDLVDTDAAGRPLQRLSHGWYALAEQTLAPGSKLGDVSGFFRYSGNEGSTVGIRRATNVGLRFKGMLSGRDQDLFGIAYTRAGMGSKYIASRVANGVAASSKETAVELTYRYQATPWLSLQPLLQRFRYPGANTAIPKAFVSGVRMEVVF